jgi:predicted DNA-binding transcriptional regulator AlpA
MFKTQDQVQSCTKSAINLAINNSKTDAETLYGRDRLLRISEVMKLTSLKYSTLYRKAQHGTFPKPVKIGMRSSAWVLGVFFRCFDAPLYYCEPGVVS